MVGREGMLGAQLALGVATTPLRALVQGAGAALAHRRAGFQRRAGAQPGAAARLDRYVYVLMAQLAARPPACASTCRPAPGALAADEPGPRPRRHLPCDARVPGLHAGRAPGRHHRRGQRAAAPRPDRATTAANSPCSTAPGSRPRRAGCYAADRQSYRAVL